MGMGSGIGTGMGIGICIMCPYGLANIGCPPDDVMTPGWGGMDKSGPAVPTAKPPGQADCIDW